MVSVGNRGLFQSVGPSIGIAFVLLSVFALASCNPITTNTNADSILT